MEGTTIVEPAFSPIEKTVSFYTRNDFAILNNLLLGRWEDLWKSAFAAYQDNRGIMEEYESGVRAIKSEYDRKWLNCLKERLFDELDGEAKRRVIETARADIANLLNAMEPAREDLLLFRTAWIDTGFDAAGAYAYSAQYKAVPFTVGSVFNIETISSCSLTPYREEENVGSDFYRYEIHVPAGNSILRLDPFVTHNEEGEVLLPPMRCRASGIRSGGSPRRRGVIALDYLGPLSELGHSPADQTAG